MLCTILFINEILKNKSLSPTTLQHLSHPIIWSVKSFKHNTHGQDTIKEWGKAECFITIEVIYPDTLNFDEFIWSFTKLLFSLASVFPQLQDSYV